MSKIGPKTIEATLQGVIDDEWRDGDYKVYTTDMAMHDKIRVALTKRVGTPPNDKKIASQFDIDSTMLVGMSEGELLYWAVEKLHDLKVDVDLFDWQAETDEKLRAQGVWDATIAQRPVKARRSAARVQEATETPQRPHKAVRKRSEHAPTVQKNNVELWAEGQAENLDTIIEANTTDAQRLLAEMEDRIRKAQGTSPAIMPQPASWHALPVVPVRAASDQYYDYKWAGENEPWHVQLHPGTKLAEADKRSWWRRVIDNITG